MNKRTIWGITLSAVINVIFIVYFILSLTGEDTLPDIHSESLEGAWAEFNRVTDEVEISLINSKAYSMDEYHKSAAYDLLRMLVSSQLDGEISGGDGEFPHFRAMLDPGLRFGIDNPDTYYRTANIANRDGKTVYRVWGNRGTTADFLFEQFDAAKVEGAMSVLDDNEMTFGSDGSFELYLSAQPMDGNWMELKQSDVVISLIARNSFGDWNTEKAGNLHIERVGSAGTVSEIPSEEQMIKRLDRISEIMRGQGIFWPEFSQKLLFLPKNSMIKFRPTGELGILTQYNSLGHFDLEDDEALVIRVPEVDADYAGLHLANFWGSSPDWVNHFTSLSWGRNGQAQAFKGHDGMYTMIVSAVDPGYKNWIDTTGMKRGVLVMRLQSAGDRNAGKIKPELKVVSLDKLTDYIPDDMPVVSPEERSSMLESRQKQVDERYAIW